MPTPTFSILQDSTATWATYEATWLIDKVDDGPAVPEAGVDEFVGSVWANGVDEALTQLNAACQGEDFVDAWAVNAVISGAHADADNACVGTTATANNGITIRGTGLCSLVAADAGSNEAGRFQYDHSGTPQWEVWVEGTEALDIRAASIATAVPLLHLTAASAALVLGSGGGSPFIALDKSSGGLSGYYLRDEASVIRGDVVLDDSENVLIEHRTAAGAEDATVTVGADAVTIAAATTTVSDDSPTMHVGSGSGAPTLSLRKADGSAFDVLWQVGSGGYRWGNRFTSSENLEWNRYSAAQAFLDTPISIAASDGLVTFATVALASGGLRTGYRSLGVDAALTLAATDKTIELNKNSGATAATMTATAAGHEVEIFITTFAAGTYTLACTLGATGGTVTLGALMDGCKLVYSGSAWKLLALYGAAAFA